MNLPGRVLVRSLPASAPHFFRDKGQWCCRGRLGPWGYGVDADAAHKDWERARMAWARQIPEKEEQARRPLMAHVGRYPMTESDHVQQA